MGKLQVVSETQAIADADSVRRGAPFADAVEREDGRLVARTRKEGARRVTLVVVGEHDGNTSGVGQGLPQQAAHVELVLEPHRNGLGEAQKSAGSECQVRLDQPVELQERLVVEGKVVELVRGETGLGQTVCDRADGKARIVLAAAESLFLSGGDDGAVDHDGRRAVVIEGRDAKNCRQRRAPSGRVAVAPGADYRNSMCPAPSIGWRRKDRRSAARVPS